MVKKITIIIASFLLFIACLNLFSNDVYADSEVDVYIHQKKLETDVKAVLQDGRVLVPMRAIFESLGAEIDWDQENSIVTGRRNGVEVTLGIGKKEGTVNNEITPLDVPVIILNGRTLVPLRFIGESLGEEVNWDSKLHIAFIGDFPSNLVESDVKDQTGDTTPVKPDADVKEPVATSDKYAPPKGWVPPTIKSKLTDDGAKNIKIIVDELGFYQGSEFTYSAIYNPFAKSGGVEDILIGSPPDANFDISITFKGWRSKHPDYKEYNKIPYIAKELFKFYEVPDLYKLIDSNFRKIDNKWYKYGDRNVRIFTVNDSMVIIVGKPGLKYDNDWNIVK